MKKIKKIAVLGGDMRQIHIARYYKEKGYEVITAANSLSDDEYPFNKESLSYLLSELDMMILPLPMTRDGITLNAPHSKDIISLDDIFSVTYGVAVIALPETNADIKKMISDDTFLIEYAKSEEFILKNALASAEGALAVSISESDKTIFGSVYAICGYGRIGRILTHMLVALGADVKVFARKSRDRTLAILDGANGFDISEISDNIYDVDVIINTVPAVIMGEKELSHRKKELIIIELASLPGGVCENVCESLGVRLISAHSLPGKFSAYSSAHYIIECICDILKENEVIL